MKYRVVIKADEAGVFVAECPSLPGCISQGKMRAEALVNIKEGRVRQSALKVGPAMVGIRGE